MIPPFDAPLSSLYDSEGWLIKNVLLCRIIMLAYCNILCHKVLNRWIFNHKNDTELFVSETKSHWAVFLIWSVWRWGKLACSLEKLFWEAICFLSHCYSHETFNSNARILTGLKTTRGSFWDNSDHNLWGYLGMEWIKH